MGKSAGPVWRMTGLPGFSRREPGGEKICAAAEKRSRSGVEAGWGGAEELGGPSESVFQGVGGLEGGGERGGREGVVGRGGGGGEEGGGGGGRGGAGEGEGGWVVVEDGVGVCGVEPCGGVVD